MADSDQVAMYKTRLRYGLVAIVITAGLLVGGYIAAPAFQAIVTGIFGF